MGANSPSILDSINDQVTEMFDFMMFDNTMGVVDNIQKLANKAISKIENNYFEIMGSQCYHDVSTRSGLIECMSDLLEKRPKNSNQYQFLSQCRVLLRQASVVNRGFIS